MAAGRRDEVWDVVVVGGGAAGLSGALTLARARRRVLVVDAGQQRNLQAAGVHGFLTRDGLPPSELVTLGRAEVERYGGVVWDGEVVHAARDDDGFLLGLGDGRAVRARRLLVTTGLVDELPAVPGLAERWGREVVHCPYCHGYELDGGRVGVLATSSMAVHQALMFQQWGPAVFLAHTSGVPAAEDAAKLAALGVEVVEGEVVGVEVDHDRLTGVRLADGSVVALDAIAVQSRAVARPGVLKDLGLTAAPHPMAPDMGVQFEADPVGKTSVPGLWLAGNVRNLGAQVVSAAAEGVMAGATLNFDLIEEDAARRMAATPAG